MAKEGRSILAMIFRNLIQSFKPRQISGNLVGRDYFGNKYFEIPANLGIGKRKPSRWFEPQTRDNFEQEIPAEWEAWLRGRRNAPPAEEEVLRNLALMQEKKKNAQEIQEKERANLSNKFLQEQKGMESFPKYSEYETMPGKHEDKERQREKTK